MKRRAWLRFGRGCPRSKQQSSARFVENSALGPYFLVIHTLTPKVAAVLHLGPSGQFCNLF